MRPLLPAVLLLAPLAAAQSPLVALPEFDVAWAGSPGSSAGIGANSSRVQNLFASPFPLGTPVFGIGLRPVARTSDYAAFTADVEIRVSSTPVSPAAASTTFANNIGSDEAVAFPRQTVSVPLMPANRSTGAFVQFPFATPFVFGTNGNTNVNVDMLVYGRSAGASFLVDRAIASTGGGVITAGAGCGSGTISSSGTYAAGGTFTVSLANATPNATAWLLPSFDMKSIAGAPILPLSLSIIGAEVGCDLLLDPVFGGFARPTSASGAASMTLPVGALSGSLLTGWQWLYQVPPSAANPIGLATTALRWIRVGPQTCSPRGRYVYNIANVANSSGFTSDSVLVMQFLVP